LGASERSAGSYAFGGCIASRQDAMLEELHEMTTRIEKLSQAEHDLLSDVHPQVSEIKEHVENVREVVSSEKN
jgi:DNA replication initiation complex subunit (GINS family)